MRVEAHYHWLTGPGDIQFVSQSFDLANLAPDEIFCRTLYSAISPGTELAAYTGAEPLRAHVPAYPRWLGYMNVAEVVSSGTTEIPKGAIVYSHAAHRSHFTLKKSDILARIPREADLTAASLIYLYRLAWTGLRRAGNRTFRRVAIVGAGAIAQCIVELAGIDKSECLAVSDHANAKKELGALGAQVLSRGDAEQKFVGATLSDADLFDLVIVTTNSWRDWRIALSLARFGGIISVLGFPGRGQSAPDFNPLTPSLFYDRQLVIMGAGQAAPGAGEGREKPESLTGDISMLLEMMAAKKINPSRLCIGTHPARDLAGAYARLKEQGRAPGTIVLDWMAQ